MTRFGVIGFHATCGNRKRIGSRTRDDYLLRRQTSAFVNTANTALVLPAIYQKKPETSFRSWCYELSSAQVNASTKLFCNEMLRVQQNITPLWMSLDGRFS
jgi:hypothetical protein